MNDNHYCDINKDFVEEYFILNKIYAVLILWLPMITVLITNILIIVNLAKKKFKKRRLQEIKINYHKKSSLVRLVDDTRYKSYSKPSSDETNSFMCINQNTNFQSVLNLVKCKYFFCNYYYSFNEFFSFFQSNSCISDQFKQGEINQAINIVAGDFVRLLCDF